MRYRKNYIYIILLLVVLILNTWILHNGEQCRSKNLLLQERDSLMRINLGIIETKEWMQYESTGLKLSSELMIEDENGIRFKISDLCDNNAKLICYFSDQNCDACLKHVMVYLKDFTHSVGENNLLLLTSFQKKRDVVLLKRNYNIKNKLYKVTKGSIGIPLEHNNTPFIFIVDNDYCVKNLFIPEKKLPQLTENYFYLMKQKMR